MACSGQCFCFSSLSVCMLLGSLFSLFFHWFSDLSSFYALLIFLSFLFVSFLVFLLLSIPFALLPWSFLSLLVFLFFFTFLLPPSVSPFFSVSRSPGFFRLLLSQLPPVNLFFLFFSYVFLSVL
jgi:hypothetical protein